jgi:hypothetical protein
MRSVGPRPDLSNLVRAITSFGAKMIGDKSEGTIAEKAEYDKG